MQYFIGIIPPYEFRDKVIELQRHWPNNGLPSVVEPHITIKAQGGLTEDMSWIEKVRNMCSVFPSFQLSIVEPRSFRNSVLYLGVESQQIFELHKRLVGTVAPTTELIQRYFELDLYTPHLTLGQTYWGMSESELEEMRNEATTALYPFASYEVNQVRIYREIEPNKYVPFQDVPLA